MKRERKKEKGWINNPLKYRGGPNSIVMSQSSCVIYNIGFTLHCG
jgi:hypothetical protein